MGEVQNTAENLQASIEGEGFEFEKMYPKFVAEAQEEANEGATISFKNAMAVEEIHHGLYSKAMEVVKAGNDLPESKFFVCKICGNTVLDKAPNKCSICGSPRNYFFEVS